VLNSRAVEKFALFDKLLDLRSDTRYGHCYYDALIGNRVCDIEDDLGTVALGRSRQLGAKQPHQIYFMTNGHKSKFDKVC